MPALNRDNYQTLSGRVNTTPAAYAMTKAKGGRFLQIAARSDEIVEWTSAERSDGERGGAGPADGEAKPNEAEMKRANENGSRTYMK